jgi:hypothetical protein
MKFYNKIDLQSLESDLELGINVAKKIRQRNSLKIEVDLLGQEKERLGKSIDIMQAKIMKVIELLAKAITRAAACGIRNITSAIFSADTQLTQLTNMLELANDGGKTTTPKKMKKYNADGKLVEGQIN